MCQDQKCCSCVARRSPPVIKKNCHSRSNGGPIIPLHLCSFDGRFRKQGWPRFGDHKIGPALVPKVRLENPFFTHAGNQKLCNALLEKDKLHITITSSPRGTWGTTRALHIKASLHKVLRIALAPQSRLLDRVRSKPLQHSQPAHKYYRGPKY